ncbi:hypothetical protein DJ466_07470 [Staphylococcus pseudintermedius]|uniref:sporulation-delaying protein SdpB family protein n=1 Tax=Staphylococcus pseudintermedius TaxID=283734 RepID=UPI000C1C5A32|nr:sporulation-delaying protein SdpB family protein [Staphylococcus pseudintermedius]EGQ3561272.1 hypothetical protein [Staphylococcus pseudintermedius]EGQ3563391.1 hypothetical protein [Staphylococcus pseudintermedius]TOY73237.1 hypothetical protein DJ466_07470 [Staphylococcus pseudintermedius]
MKSLINNINKFTSKIKNNFYPWTFTFGIGRSFIGLGMFVALFFNKSEYLFLKTSNSNSLTKDSGLSIFSYLPQNYIYFDIVRLIFAFIAFLVLIGWRPRITAIFHVYVAYCLNSSGITIDGGEQVNLVLSVLMMPILLFDKRKWHWSQKTFDIKGEFRIIAYIAYIFIRIQIAILYLHAFVGKLSNEEWVNGTAIYYYLNDPMLGSPKFLDFLIQPILRSDFIPLITWCTLLIQLLLFCGLFIEKRYWKYLFIFSVLFHESIALILGLFSFSFVMTGALILYLIPLETKPKFKLLKLRGRNNEI